MSVSRPEHLYEMDYLKEGIGLRAMPQRDPLVEYRWPHPASSRWRVVEPENGLGNLAACGIDQLATVVNTRLKRIQYRHGSSTP